MPRGDKLEDADKIVGAVLDRRARERPTSAARDRSHSLAGRAGPILDPLRFVEHDEIEVQAAARDDPPIAIQRLVIGELDRGVSKLPLPVSLALISFDRDDRQLRRPESEL